MNIEEFRAYCLQKKGSHEDFPFGDDTLVMKVLGKIFALANLDGPMRINLKCDPEKAIDLREQFPSVRQAYHMDKKHWNTIDIDGLVPDLLIREWIDHSYELVVAKLPLKLKREL
jgi:predicted DNA-binding protein (MmcQ/YjbR family)